MTEGQVFLPESNVELTSQQKLNWLRLIRSENVGPATFRALINRFGSAQHALEALPDLSHKGGKKKITLASLDEAEQELCAIHDAGAALICPADACYPQLLKHIDSAPPLLTVKATYPATHAKR